MFFESPLLKAVPDWSMAPRPRATRRAAPAAEEPEEPRMAPQLERKRTALAALQLLPEAEQPKSTVVSLENEIRALMEDQGEPECHPAQGAQQQPQEPKWQLVEQPEMAPQAASGPPEPLDGPEPPISRTLANQYRREVETGRSARGRVLSQEELQERVSKLPLLWALLGLSSADLNGRVISLHNVKGTRCLRTCRGSSRALSPSARKR